MALVLYGHPFSSCTQKVLVALYENGTPFTWRVLDTPETFEALSVPLTVMASDIYQRKSVAFSEGPLRPALAELARVPRHDHVALRGLTRSEVQEFLATAVSEIAQWRFTPSAITQTLMADYTAEVQPKGKAAAA